MEKVSKKEYDQSYHLANKEKRNAKSKIWHQQNKTRATEYSKNYYKENKSLFKSHSLKKFWPEYTNQECLDKYNKLLEKQNGVCAVCKKYETSIFNGQVRNLAVDHCHKTGKVRGLLCLACNQTLGRIKENVETVNNLLTYIKFHNDT